MPSTELKIFNFGNAPTTYLERLGSRWVKPKQDTPPLYLLEINHLLPQHSGNCWYQCTIKGGREGRDIDVVQLLTVCEKLGAGEILLNCMDKDGTNSGYDLELILMVKDKVTIPVIASSGAGKVEHFSEVFNATDAEAALAAGIFHRKEVPISDVKKHLQEEGRDTLVIKNTDSDNINSHLQKY